ncbi:MAG: Flp family type IVb pilin [bacterium]
MMMNIFKSFICDEEGQSMSEYGLIIGLIAVIVVIAFITLSPQIRPWISDAVTNRAGEGQDAINNAM